MVVGWFWLLQFGFLVMVLAKFWWKMVVGVYARERERERVRENLLLLLFDCVVYIIFLSCM